MSNHLKTTGRIERFDRPCEHLVVKDAAHAPWTVDASRGDNDKAAHRRYHGLFEDLMN
ncbi:hypothetical protein [Yoonia algicola]|uniref:Uncharacterized protein n=1 Tax=Yoonia algicola TaxID=3137368 RepID=A0AAN0M175_9RHOB